jgi:hypothetical protein
MNRFQAISIACSGLLMAGCTVDIEPVPIGVTPELMPEQGMLVIVFDLENPLEDIRLNPEGFSARSLNIESMPTGVNAFIQAVAAGRYCLDRFKMFGRELRFLGSDGICVEVEPGVISYGGHFAPRSSGFGLMTRSFHYFDYRAFNALMERDYPDLLDAFELDRSDFHPDQAEDF